MINRLLWFMGPLLVIVVSGVAYAIGIGLGEPIPSSFTLHKGQKVRLFMYSFVNVPDNNGNGVPEVYGFREISEPARNWLSHNPDYLVAGYSEPRQSYINGAHVWVNTSDLSVGSSYSFASGICDERTDGVIGAGVCVQIGNRTLTITPYSIPIYETRTTNGSLSHFQVRWGTPSPLNWHISTYDIIQGGIDSIAFHEISQCQIISKAIPATDTSRVIYDGDRSAGRFYALVGYDSLGEAVALSRSFHVLPSDGSSFQLLSPRDGGILTLESPVVRWEGEAGKSYTVSYSRDSLFTVQYDIGVLSGDSCVMPVASLEDGTYYWKVRDNDGTWSRESGWQFRVCRALLPPAPFSLMSPTNGAQMSTRLPSFEWSQSADPGDKVNYRLIVSGTPAFVDTILDAMTIHSYYHSSQMLPDDAAYYWKVIAADEGGLVRDSESIGQFAVSQPDLPSGFTPLEPSWAVGATPTTTSRLPSLVWSKSTPLDPGDAVRYTVHLTKDSLFRSYSEYANIEDTFFVPTLPLEEDQVYYWRVHATNARGAIRHGFGPPLAFMVSEVDMAPSLPLPVSPGDLDTVLTTAIPFSWTAAVDDRYDLLLYQLHISSSAQFTDTVFMSAFSFQGGASTMVPELDPGAYYWRVTVRSLPLSGAAPVEVTGPSRALVVRSRRLRLLSPMPNTHWKINTTATITWASDYPVNLVSLAFSIDAGVTWNLIHESIPANPASATWEVPSFDGGCRLRIADVERADVTPDTVEFAISQDGDPSRLVLFLPLDGSAIDSSGNGSHAVREGGYYGVDRFGNEGHSYQEGRLSSVTSLLDGMNGISISCWVRTGYYWNGSSYLRTTGSASLTVQDPSYPSWRHVVVTCDVTGLARWFSNGSLVSQSTGSPPQSSSLQVTAGGSEVSIDDLRVYNRVLTLEEIYQLMRSRTPPEHQLALLSPHGGDSVHVLSPVTISWHTATPLSVNLDYTTDHGVSWHSIANDIPGDVSSFSYKWPVTDSAQVNIAVRVIGSAAPFACARSDGETALYRTFIGRAWIPYSNGTVQWVDVDADGTTDILCAGSVWENGGFVPGQLTWYSPGPAGFVRSPLALSCQRYPLITCADTDNDGDIDALTTAGREPLSLQFFEGNGGSLHQGSLPFSQARGYSAGSWGDMDNDGDLDLFLEGTLYRRDSTAYTAIPLLPGAPTQSNGDWCDFDGDGDLDLAVTGASATNILRNQNGLLTDIGLSIPGTWNGMIEWCDLNGDGRWDFFVIGGQVAKGFLNTGESFAELATSFRGMEFGRLACGDIDNDGTTDVILSGSEGSVFYLNREGGFELREDGLSEVDRTWQMGSVALCDQDRDGDLDLAIAGSSNVTIFENLSVVPNVPPSTPLTHRGRADTLSFTISWERSHDDKTPSSSITYNIRVGTTHGGSEIVSSMSALGGSRLLIGHGNVWNDTAWTISRLAPGKYYWSVQAIDNGYAASAFSPVDSIIVGRHTCDLIVQHGWNLVSLPMAVGDTSASASFPLRASNPFAFSNGAYTESTHLARGIGYWIKFDEVDTVIFSGSAYDALSIPVADGWSLVGSCSEPVQTGSITSVPGGIICSPFYGYQQSGYIAADELLPGKGYWIKTSEPGMILLTGTSIPKVFTGSGAIEVTGPASLSIEDRSKRRATLFIDIGRDDRIVPADCLLPPVPPVGCFDARFSGDLRALSGVEGLIEVQSAQYPIEIVPAGIGTLQLALIEEDGSPQGRKHRLEDGVAVRILNPMVDRFRLVQESYQPLDYSLGQNFPNPFNPTTRVRFSVPEAVFVRLKVFNVLGQEVAVVADRKFDRGVHEVEFRAQGLASGVYAYQMEAGPYKSIRTMVIIK